jgi:hypothetical protein
MSMTVINDSQLDKFIWLGEVIREFFRDLMNWQFYEEAWILVLRFTEISYAADGYATKDSRIKHNLLGPIRLQCILLFVSCVVSFIHYKSTPSGVNPSDRAVLYIYVNSWIHRRVHCSRDTLISNTSY